MHFLVLLRLINGFIENSTCFYNGDDNQSGYIGEVRDPYNDLIFTIFRFVVTKVPDHEDRVRVFIYDIDPFGQNYNENTKVDDNKETILSSLDDFKKWFHYRFGKYGLQSYIYSGYPDDQEDKEEL